MIASIKKDTKSELPEIWQKVPAAKRLQAVRDGMYARAKKNLEDHIYEAHSLEEAHGG